MAAWQFELYIINSAARDTVAKGVTATLPVLPLPLVYYFQEELAHYLGAPWLMLSDWLVFGPESGNRVDIVFETEADATVSVRFDVRDEAPQFLVLISDLTRFHGCHFISASTGELIEPDLELLLEVIRRSQVNQT